MFFYFINDKALLKYRLLRASIHSQDFKLHSKGGTPAKDTTAHRWQSKSHSNEERKGGSRRRAPKSETIHAAHL